MAEDLVFDRGRIEVGVFEIWADELHDVDTATIGHQDEVASHPQAGQIRLHDLLLGELLHAQDRGIEIG